MNQRTNQTIWGHSNTYCFNEATRVAIGLIALHAETDTPASRFRTAESVFDAIEDEFRPRTNTPKESIAAFRDNPIFVVDEYAIRLADDWQQRFFGNCLTDVHITSHDLCRFSESILGGECTISTRVSEIVYTRDLECETRCSNHRELIYAVVRDVAATANLIFEGDPTYRFLEERRGVFT